MSECSNLLDKTVYSLDELIKVQWIIICIYILFKNYLHLINHYNITLYCNLDFILL